MIRVFIAAVTVLFLSAKLASAASFTIFTDRTAFENAVGSGLTTETFNSATSDISFGGSSTTFGQLTLAADRPSPPFNLIDSPPVSGAIGGDGSAAVSFFTTSSFGASISFDAPVTAFGADFFSFNDDYLRTEISILGDYFNPGVSSVGSLSFFGVISDQAFSAVLFAGIDNDVFGMDNVSFNSSISVVPLPAALPLMAGALAIIGLFGWRRKSS